MTIEHRPTKANELPLIEAPATAELIGVLDGATGRVPVSRIAEMAAVLAPATTPVFAVADAPSADTAGVGATIYVTDADGGARPFWSDGSDWRDAAGGLLS